MAWRKTSPYCRSLASPTPCTALISAAVAGLLSTVLAYTGGRTHLAGSLALAPGGAWLRREQWTLRDLAPIDGTRPAVYDCAHHRATTKVQELAW